MCTWNKRHPNVFCYTPVEQSNRPETSRGEEPTDDNEEKTTVERQLDFLQHLHV